MHSGSKRKNGIKQKGFTLIEMLVVIGIIVIVTTTAVPGFKGIYQEFRINQTIEEVHTLIMAYRSHYLMSHEAVDSTTSLPESFIRFLPGNYYKKNNNVYQFSIQPYKGESYIFWNDSPSIYLVLNNISDTKVLQQYYNKLASLFPNAQILQSNESIGIRVL